MKSAKKIAEYLNIEIGPARQVRALIQGTINPDIFDSVYNWSRQCYNEPPYQAKVMVALNEVTGGYGVEGCSCCNHHFDYVNMGETYAATIIYDHGEYIFSSWGDYVEEQTA